MADKQGWDSWEGDCEGAGQPRPLQAFYGELETGATSV